MLVSYWNLLALSLALLLLLILVNRLLVRIASRRLRKMAACQRMRYSPIDRFHLAPRVGEWLGTGAADVRVRDLMYRVGDDTYLYVFTAEYAVETISGTRRCRVVARTSEPTGRSIAKLAAVTVADPRLSIREQYAAVLDMNANKPAGEQ